MSQALLHPIPFLVSLNNLLGVFAEDLHILKTRIFDSTGVLDVINDVFQWPSQDAKA